MMADLLNWVHSSGHAFFGTMWPVVWVLIKIACILLPILGLVTFLTLWERKVIGWMHARLGPNRVGPLGLIQPIADAFKLLLKEIIVPDRADKVLFWLAPVLTIVPALVAWVVVPFGAERRVGQRECRSAVRHGGDVARCLRCHHRRLGVQFQICAFGGRQGSGANDFVRYPAGICPRDRSAGIGQSEFVRYRNHQGHGFFASHGLTFLSWNWLPLLPVFIIYVICSIAETARHPFDAVEGKSEIVAGHMVEYSGMAFALFFMAEYANMILFSALAAVMFLGGWLAPVDWPVLAWIPGWMWLGVKTFFIVSSFIWVRATFPRYRYDHTMRLGWKVFIPVTLGYLVFVACWMQTPFTISAVTDENENDPTFFQYVFPDGTGTRVVSDAESPVPAESDSALPGRKNTAVSPFSRHACIAAR